MGNNGSTSDKDTFRKEGGEEGKDGEVIETECTPEDRVVTSALAVAVYIGACAFWVGSSLTPPAGKVVEADIWKLQIANFVAWAFKIAATVRTIKGGKMRRITNGYDIKLKPIGWAFAIWSLIYLIEIFFVAYQTVPQSWVPSRNIDCIFGQINWLFSFNQFLQGIWLFTWVMGTPTWFIISGVINFLMLASGLIILQYSSYAKLNLYEIITLRAMFSIYIAWVAAANIVNISYILYSSGLQTNQVRWSQAILFVGYVVYAAYAFIERNPLFGLVYCWVLAAIRASQYKGNGVKDKSEEVAKTCTVFLYIHWATLAGATGLCAYELSNKTLTHGLFL